MSVPRKEASSRVRLKDHQIYSPGERGRDMTGKGSGLGGLLSTLAAVEREWKALDLRCLSMVKPACDWMISLSTGVPTLQLPPPASFRVGGAPLLRLLGCPPNDSADS